MPTIQVTLDRLDAEVLLPLIMEQSQDQSGTAGGAYWLVLHTAITAGLTEESDKGEAAPS